ncbi:outer membrane beta-barrel protein [Sulfuricurvum sp.]|uniref:outer membrane beta-barrel protein n=1 Tax=Sulfuricurvum sp. TaxID=2025608 RepID=UPI00286E50EF|nr:outer membrane beta-barrel protein [Sulfuricurvum sp.]
MKKLVLAGLFSAVLMANESGVYVGGDISKVKEEYKTSTETSTNKSTAYALNLGYYFDANTRAYTFYQYIGKGDFDQSTDAYGVGCDYLFGNSSFKPFVGAIVAYSVYKDGDYTQDGLAYGGRMGVNYKINPNVSLDAGYRYLFSDAKTSIDETTYFQGFFAGINYKF